jgi:hypothetical protein
MATVIGFLLLAKRLFENIVPILFFDVPAPEPVYFSEPCGAGEGAGFF